MNDQIDTAKAFPEEAKLYAKDEAIEGEVTKEKPVTQKALTIRDTQATNFLDPNLYIQLKALALDFIKSSAIPAVWKTSEQVLVGLQTGAEMGMKPMEAMNSLYPVNGAINVWGKATTRRLREHDWTIKYSNETQETCTATVSKDREKYTETYTFSEAQESGYTTDSSGKLKIGWRAGMNRKKKLRYGVLSLIISTEIPEVLGSAMGIVEVSEDYDFSTKNEAKTDELTKKREALQRSLNASNSAKQANRPGGLDGNAPSESNGQKRQDDQAPESWNEQGKDR